MVKYKIMINAYFVAFSFVLLMIWLQPGLWFARVESFCCLYSRSFPIPFDPDFWLTQVAPPPPPSLRTLFHESQRMRKVLHVSLSSKASMTTCVQRNIWVALTAVELSGCGKHLCLKMQKMGENHTLTPQSTGKDLCKDLIAYKFNLLWGCPAICQTR